jgi:hypothetical protein
MSGCVTLKPGDTHTHTHTHTHSTATAHQSAPTVTTVTALYYQRCCQSSFASSCFRHNLITGHKKLILNLDWPPFCTTYMARYIAGVNFCIKIAEGGLGIDRKHVIYICKGKVHPRTDYEGQQGEKRYEVHIQGVTGGRDKTSGGCSLC